MLNLQTCDAVPMAIIQRLELEKDVLPDHVALLGEICSFIRQLFFHDLVKCPGIRESPNSTAAVCFATRTRCMKLDLSGISSANIISSVTLSSGAGYILSELIGRTCGSCALSSQAFIDWSSSDLP